MSATKIACIREGLTPIPEYGTLLIDCSVHGPIGVIAAGEDEHGRAEAEFAKHLLPYAELQARIDALEKQVAAGHRVQLAIAGQWLGHAADHLGDGPAADYLNELGEWLTGNAEGDEPEPGVALQADQPAEPTGAVS